MQNINLETIDNIILCINESEAELRKLAAELEDEQNSSSDLEGDLNNIGKLNKCANEVIEYLDSKQVLNFLKAFMR